MTVAVVGLGYVGLPLAVAFAEAGADVVGLDVSADTVAAIGRGESHIEDIPSERLAAVVQRIAATTDPAALAGADAVVICVPTPLSAQREPDLGPLLSAAHAVGDHLRAGQLIVLESTTYPGTTREQLVPILEASGMTAGEDFNVAFSPERVDPGRTDYTLRNTPKVIGGLTPACLERAKELYAQVCDVLVPVSTPEAAELEKLLENIFRSVNIALVNELAMLCDRMGIDVWEVVEAAATKPYGFMKFQPGPGMGGHCLPVDPFYLSWKAREVGFATEFIELAGKVNQHMPEYCVERVVRALNDIAKPVKGSRIALLGVSYKAGVGDMRESPALKIGRLLQELGAELAYHDAFVPEVPALGLTGVGLDEALAGADAAVVITAHPGIDHDAVVARVPVLVDFRGVTTAPGAVRL
jgi:UDP-N-acetyl-D-glucosamine dehydrogenase